MQVDADQVAPNLFVGSKPPPGSYPGISAIVLCAQEIQPPSNLYDVDIVRAPLDDDPTRPVRLDEIRLVMATAQVVKRYLNNRQRVLVTCAMGCNRSAMIAATAMILTYGYHPDSAIRKLRRMRPCALMNRQFETFVRTLARPSRP